MNWLLKIRPFHFLVASILFVEVLTAFMSILFQGRVTYDYLISGAVISFIVASVMIYLFSLSSRLQFEKDLLQKEVLERKKAQHEFDRIFELSYDLICTATMTHFLRVNPAGEKILGYNTDELQKIPFLDLIHPDDVEPTRLAVENELKKGRSVVSFRNRYRNKDGHFRWLEWMTHPDLEDNMLYAVARDITDRMKAEEDLLLLKRSVEMISTGITISDRDGRIHYTNPAEAQMHGYTVEELIGKDVNIFMPDGHRNTKTREKSIEEISAWKEWSREVEEIRKDGTVFPVHLRSLPVSDPKGESIHIITTSENITERKRAEKKLLLQAQMIDILKDSLITTDLDGYVRTWNNGAERLFGYPASVAIGKHISFVYPPEEHGHLQNVIALLKEKGQYEAEVRMQRHSGEPLHAILSLAMIHDVKGIATGMLGLSIDITARKQMEEQLRQAIEEKEMLMREAHHRTKNNLAVVQSLLKLQSRQIQDETAVSALRDTANRVKTMSMIHEKLYSRGDLSRINVHEYIHSLATELFFSFDISPSKIKLLVNIPELSLALDYIIPVGMIVNELVTNALKYAFPEIRDGEILIALEETGDNAFELTVRDNGIGLPEDFDISEVKTLGLQIVESLVMQVHGKMEVVQDNGTLFRIAFSGKA